MIDEGVAFSGRSAERTAIGTSAGRDENAIDTNRRRTSFGYILKAVFPQFHDVRITPMIDANAVAVVARQIQCLAGGSICVCSPEQRMG
jgi:hypothetical protein